MNLHILSKQNLFVLVYINQGNNAKRFNVQKFHLPKGIIKNYNVIINRKNFITKQLIQIQNDMKKSEN